MNKRLQFEPFDLDMADNPEMVRRAERLVRLPHLAKPCRNGLGDIPIGVPMDTARDKRQVTEALKQVCWNLGAIRRYHIEPCPNPPQGCDDWSRITRTR
jgi:hypothetical protein